jgi:hypothetical protein
MTLCSLDFGSGLVRYTTKSGQPIGLLREHRTNTLCTEGWPRSLT